MRQRVILASHGSLAEGMLSAVDMILTSQGDKVLAYGLDTYETPQKISEAVSEEMGKEKDSFYTIICDVRGGSVFNELFKLCTKENLCVIAGMHLGLVLEAVMVPDNSDFKASVSALVEETREMIQYYDNSAISENKEGEEDELW